MYIHIYVSIHISTHIYIYRHIYISICISGTEDEFEYWENTIHLKIDPLQDETVWWDGSSFLAHLVSVRMMHEMKYTDGVYDTYVHNTLSSLSPPLSLSLSLSLPLSLSLLLSLSLYI